MYMALRERTVVKKDGVLEIRDPVLREGTRVEVIVIVESPPPKVDALGWPEDFFETFAGCLPDLSIEECS
jgi:hypothetical protein